MMLRGRIAVASAWLLLSTPLGAAAQRTQAVDGRLRDARAQLKSGHLDPAQRAVESVLERRPQSVAALLLLGEILEARKDLKGAVGAYQQAIAVSPRDAGAYDKLGFALGRLDCVTEAIEQFREAVRLAGDSAAAHQALALALQQAGAVQEAKRHFDEARKLSRRTRGPETSR